MFAPANTGFPVELSGVGELHAAFLDEIRTPIRWWCLVQEIRDHGPKKTGRSPFERLYYAGKKTAAKSNNSHAWSESIGKKSLSAHVRWGEHGAPVQD
jgi:hypothetical protein